jgi:hypothetical protein
MIERERGQLDDIFLLILAVVTEEIEMFFAQIHTNHVIYNTQRPCQLNSDEGYDAAGKTSIAEKPTNIYMRVAGRW